MGRIKGDKERKSEKQRVACVKNGQRPRGRWANTEERAELEKAKTALRMAMPDAAKRLIGILTSADTSDELFLQAFKLAADRGGLPALPLTVIVMGDEAQED
jgi:hypothetical protein